MCANMSVKIYYYLFFHICIFSQKDIDDGHDRFHQDLKLGLLLEDVKEPNENMCKKKLKF